MNNLDTRTNSDVTAQVVDMGKTMRSVYFKMFIGILLTAFTSFFLMTYLTGVTAYMVQHGFTYLLLFAAEIGLVIWLTSCIDTLPAGKAKLLFYMFSILNGITLTPMLLAYTNTSIVLAFFITAGMFGIMSIYGFITKRDLTGWGDFLFMALIGLLICLVIQLFFSNPLFEILVSVAAVIIFVGLTAYDTQKIKKFAENPVIDSRNIATLGALSLYLDFINIFIHILKLLGKNK